MPINTLDIACADDDQDDRMLFKEALQEVRANTNLSLFKNGKELMDYLTLPNIQLPAIVFMDLNMPIMNGMQCLTEIRSNAKLKNLIVAIYSTSSSENDIEETFINGANIYINKPNNFGALKKVIGKILQLNWQYRTATRNRDDFLLRI